MKGEIRNPVLVIILAIITCGIYYYIWMYKVSEEEKINLGDESINPGMNVILAIFTCGIYGLFWMYNQGEYIQKLSAKKGIQVENEGTLFLILGLFLGPVALYLIQDKLNKIYS